MATLSSAGRSSKYSSISSPPPVEVDSPEVYASTYALYEEICCSVKSSGDDTPKNSSGVYGLSSGDIYEVPDGGFVHLFPTGASFVLHKRCVQMRIGGSTGVPS